MYWIHCILKVPNIQLKYHRRGLFPFLTDVEIFIFKDFYCIKNSPWNFRRSLLSHLVAEFMLLLKIIVHNIVNSPNTEQFEQSSIFQHVFIPNYCLARLLLSLVCQDFESFFSCAALSHFCGLSCDTVKPLSVFSLLAHLCCCPGNSLPFLQIFISRNGNLNSFWDWYWNLSFMIITNVWLLSWQDFLHEQCYIVKY